MKRFVFLFLLLVLVFSSCMKNKYQSHDLEDLFSALEDSGYYMPSSMVHDMPYDSLRKGITMLQAYKNGELKEFPSYDVNRTLEGMMCGVQDCLFPNRSPFGDSLEYYMEKFMEKAYELCPHVSFITDVVDNDSCWGVLHNPNLINSYIFYKDNYGRKKILKTDKIVYSIKSIQDLGTNKYLFHTKLSGCIAGEVYFSRFGAFELNYHKNK